MVTDTNPGTLLRPEFQLPAVTDVMPILPNHAGLFELPTECRIERVADIE